MTVDLEGPEPLYEQIAAILSARISDGTYAPRRRVPSEAAICEEFEVSRPTVRAALRLLVRHGLIVTVRGKGSFVVPDPPSDRMQPSGGDKPFADRIPASGAARRLERTRPSAADGVREAQSHVGSDPAEVDEAKSRGSRVDGEGRQDDAGLVECRPQDFHGRE